MVSWKAFLLRVYVVLLSLMSLNGLAAGMSSVKEVAIKEYDPVAYFKVGKALKGNKAFTFEWHNLIWYFDNQENRDLFAKSPEKYSPQYDGYCAWAMVEGKKSQSDPTVWKIVNGKLYLLCSKEAYTEWSKNIPGNIEKADVNWLKLISSHPEKGFSG